MKKSVFRQVGMVTVGAAMLIIAGCGKGSEAGNGSAAAGIERVTQVRVSAVQPEDLRETFTLPGTLEAWEDLTLAAEIAGPVRWVGPREGARVRKGDPILRIDPETLEANVERDQAEFDLQSKMVERLQSLVDEKFVSRQEYDNALRAFEVAGADLRRSRLALAKSTLRSPVDGVLDRLLIDRGEYVSEGAAAAIVVQVDRLKVLVDVPEKDVPYIRVGSQAHVTLTPISGGSNTGATLAGEVNYLSYRADPLTRTYQARVVVDNSAGTLRPGMIVRVGFSRRNLDDVIAIPLFALVDRGGAKVVFVEEDGFARMRTVRTGPMIGARIVIDEGLRAGERLITDGQHLLSDGTRVAAGSG
jgi:membrane fusion protein, multidrug efflux system